MNNDRQLGNPQGIFILYERLSREDGDKSESDSIANQRQLLEDHAVKNGFTPYLHISDDGYSGTNWNRPGWRDLISRIEAGEVSALLVKDSSRIGRDYIRVGAFREFFRDKNVRLICVNEGMDSDKGDDDFAPFKDIISEWHARDTSIKIKSVIKTKGEKGKRLTNAPIYGYRLDPEDKTKWVIDEESAVIVRRIFHMTIEGIGPHSLAKKLAAEKIERPSYYQTKRGIVDKKYLGGEEVMYDWNTKTITDIIAKQEYVGDTINFRTSKKSYKDRRRTKHAPEDWLIFENTHPGIVDRETWNLAQKCRETIRRPSPKLQGEANPLTGLMYCADCGGKMYNNREEKSGKMYYHKQLGKWYPRSARDVYYCSSFRNNSKSLRTNCTSHFIRTAVVRELLLETIKKTCGYVRGNEAEFVRQIREASEIQQEAAAKSSRKQLAKNQKRHTELDTVISKLFEQNATGKIADTRFETLLAGYEKEQSELSQANEKLQAELDSFDSDSVRADKFIDIVKRYTDFTELTTPMIHEFVDRIVIHEGDKSSGERTQQVDIYFNFIGKVNMLEEAPEPTPEEIAAAEKLQKQRERKRANFKRYIEKRQREMASGLGQKIEYVTTEQAI